MKTVPLGHVLREFREQPNLGQEPPVLTLTEKHGFVLQSERFTKRLALKDVSGYKVVRRGDIAFNPYLLWAGAVAHNTIVDAGVISPLYPTFRVREGFDSSFVARLLLAPEIVAAYDRIAFGSVPRRRRTSVRDFLSLEIPALPSLAEQRRIAAILAKADALRAKRRQALAHLASLTQSLYEKCVHAAPTKEVPFGDLSLRMRNGLSPSAKGTVPGTVLTLSAITQGAFDPSSVKTAFFDRSPAPEQRVSGVDLLICRGNGNRSLVGAGVVPQQDYPELVFPDTVIAAAIDTGLVRPAFLEVAWGQPAVRRQIEKGARTTNGTFKVNQQLLSSIRVSVPAVSVQEEFEKRVEALSEMRRRNQRQGASLDGFFSSLQSRAFRGEL